MDYQLSLFSRALTSTAHLFSPAAQASAAYFDALLSPAIPLQTVFHGTIPGPVDPRLTYTHSSLLPSSIWSQKPVAVLHPANVLVEAKRSPKSRTPEPGFALAYLAPMTDSTGSNGEHVSTEPDLPEVEPAILTPVVSKPKKMAKKVTAVTTKKRKRPEPKDKPSFIILTEDQKNAVDMAEQQKRKEETDQIESLSLIQRIKERQRKTTAPTRHVPKKEDYGSDVDFSSSQESDSSDSDDELINKESPKSDSDYDLPKKRRRTDETPKKVHKTADINWRPAPGSEHHTALIDAICQQHAYFTRGGGKCRKTKTALEVQAAKKYRRRVIAKLASFDKIPPGSKRHLKALYEAAMKDLAAGAGAGAGAGSGAGSGNVAT